MTLELIAWRNYLSEGDSRLARRAMISLERAATAETQRLQKYGAGARRASRQLGRCLSYYYLMSSEIYAAELS